MIAVSGPGFVSTIKLNYDFTSNLVETFISMCQGIIMVLTAQGTHI